jgi:hypothetical protein
MKAKKDPLKTTVDDSSAALTTEIATHARAVRFALVTVVAVATLVLSGAAYGADLVDAYEHASGPSRPTYDRSADRTPTYTVDQSTWDTLDQSSEDLASDTGHDEQEAGATSDESDENTCFRDSLWGIVFDAGWDALNGYSFNIGAELSATANRLINCLTYQVGLPTVTATNLSDYLMESFKNQALEALNADPTTKTFLDWVAVTAWYSVP